MCINVNFFIGFFFLKANVPNTIFLSMYYVLVTRFPGLPLDERMTCNAMLCDDK